MKFLRRLRLVVLSACLCAGSLFRVSAQQNPQQQQQQTPPPAQPPKPEAPKPQTPAQPARNPFEAPPVEQQPAQTPQQRPGQPQLEAPKPTGIAPPPANGQVVESIEIRGARRVPQDTLKAMIVTKPGDIFNEDVLRRDFMMLWNTGRLDD